MVAKGLERGERGWLRQHGVQEDLKLLAWVLPWVLSVMVAALCTLILRSLPDSRLFLCTGVRNYGSEELGWDSVSPGRGG